MSAPTTPATGTSLSERPWKQVHWSVIDVEGNGQPDPDLVEVAIVPIVDGVIGAARSWLIRPSRPVTWPAQKVHGLTTSDLAHAPTLDDVGDDILAALAKTEIVVGHQVHTDLSVLRRPIDDWPHLPAVDTLRLSRALQPDLPSHRLAALTEHLVLNADLPGPAHRAGYDATVTARLLLHFASRAGTATTAGRLLNFGRSPGAPTLIAEPKALFEIP